MFRIVFLLSTLWMSSSHCVSAVEISKKANTNPALPEIAQAVSPSPLTENYFYFGQHYGSESQFGFWNVMINVGLVVPGRLGTQPQLKYIDWDSGWQHVESSLTSQTDVFEESGGTKESLNKEFIPFAHPSGAWLPNYFLHFLGEGMLSRKLEEYYRYDNGSTPMQAKIKAIATTLAAQLTNEVVEYELPWEQRLDPLADFYFNLAGIIAFSFDGFAKLFNNDYLNYYYWPGQAIIDPQDGALFNQGEQYYFRSHLGLFSNTQLAVIAGMPASGVGIAYPINSDDHISVLWGTDVSVSKPHEKVEKLERKTNFTASEIADLYHRSINVYWDRKGSLMGSAALSYDPYAQLTLNLYPQTYTNLKVLGIPLDDIGIGGYFIASEDGSNSIGLTFSFTPVMLGYRR